MSIHSHKKPKKRAKNSAKCIKSVHGEVTPFRESRVQNLKSRYGQLYNLPKWDNGVKGYLCPTIYNNKLAKRIISKYVNKPVNEAYSDYCSKCKGKLKEFFWNLFQEEFDTRPESLLSTLKYQLFMTDNSVDYLIL